MPSGFLFFLNHYFSACNYLMHVQCLNHLFLLHLRKSYISWVDVSLCNCFAFLTTANTYLYLRCVCTPMILLELQGIYQWWLKFSRPSAQNKPPKCNAHVAPMHVHVPHMCPTPAYAHSPPAHAPPHACWTGAMTRVPTGRALHAPYVTRTLGSPSWVYMMWNYVFISHFDSCKNFGWFKST